MKISICFLKKISHGLVFILTAFLCTSAICKEVIMIPHAPIVELRQYTLHPGRRDELIELFEREFIESQEEVGMQVLGQFTDMNDSDKFVWLRGYTDMEARKKGLQDFYFGPAWQQYKNQANDTMLDSDNVLLLHEARSGKGFPVVAGKRVAHGSKVMQESIFICTIYYLKQSPDEEFLAFFEQKIMPELTKANITVLASYIPERSENNFPPLPVREGENVFVWFSSSANTNEHAMKVKLLSEMKIGGDGKALNTYFAKSPEVMILLPTLRSKIR
jgi:quinol monooxygenase YgiN